MNRQMRCEVILALLAFSGIAWADFAVVPGTCGENPRSPCSVADGNTNNGFPFNLGAFTPTSMRYQQVYLASDFGWSSSMWISQIAFRPDALIAGNQAFNSTLPDVQINLSTTSHGPDTLSTTFAENVGSNDIVVYARGPLTLSSSFAGPAGGPKNFDIVINLTTPFLYNPSAGNLLMDVRNYSDILTTQFDAQSGADAVGRGYSLLSGVNSPSADDLDSTGLVTQFTASTSVPEPAGVVWLVAVTAAGCLVFRRRQNRRIG